MTLIHATCVAVAGKGVVIRGLPGAGKSDLALRLIDGGADLVADDICDLITENGRVIAAAPPSIAGKIELRGFGIVDQPHLPSAPVALVVDLMPQAEIERLPDETVCTLEEVRVPHLALDAFTASAAAKVRLVLKALR